MKSYRFKTRIYQINMAPKTTKVTTHSSVGSTTTTTTTTAPTQLFVDSCNDKPTSTSIGISDTVSDKNIMNNYLFYASTKEEAHIIKNLIEVLQNNLIDVCFHFTKDSISLLTPDVVISTNIWINLLLDSKKFDQWYCETDLNIGVNLQHMYKMIKSIKKKDNLTLYITREKPRQLSIKRIATTGVSRKPDISHINIQSLQSNIVDLPSGYKHFHQIVTSDFQKAIKEMSALSNSIMIQGNKHQLTVKFCIDGLCEKVVELDQDPSGNGNEYNLDNIVYTFNKTYSSKILGQFIKLPGLNSTMKVYAENQKHLKIEIDVGNLGSLEIFIKS